MATIRCSNGHYYNDEDSKTCPYCNGISDVGHTIPLDGSAASAPVADIGSTIPLGHISGQDGPAAIPATTPAGPQDYGKTTPHDPVSRNSDVRPVVGWLVVIEGKKQGADFRIHAGNNTIGRTSKNDIHFDFDTAVSAENACSVIYDHRHNKFYMNSGNGSNLVYVNDFPLLNPVEIKDNDRIRVGDTLFIFRALCNDTFNYNMNADKDAK